MIVLDSKGSKPRIRNEVNTRSREMTNIFRTSRFGNDKARDNGRLSIRKSSMLILGNLS